MTLARIPSRNIYLKLIGRAHFHWRSLKAWNIAKRTCLNYAWTAIFPWSYCSLKLQILRLFRARTSKTVECRLTLKRQKQPPEVLCKKGCSYTNVTKFTGKHMCQSLVFKKEKKKTVAQAFSCEFSKIFKDAFLQNTSWRLLLTPTWHNNNVQQLLLLLLL